MRSGNKKNEKRPKYPPTIKKKSETMNKADKNKRLTIFSLILIIAVLILLLGLFSAGAIKQIKNGSGFLFIPSSTCTATGTSSPTPSSTNTATPTATNTSTPTPTATNTITPTPSKTNTAEPTIDLEAVQNMAAMTAVAAFQSSLVPTEDIELVKTLSANFVYSEITARAEIDLTALAPTETPVFQKGTSKTGYSARKGNDQAMMVYIESGENSYWLDQFEVTIGQYQKCVSSEICAPPSLEMDADFNERYKNYAYANYPITHVNWYQAKNYCEWAGKRLPDLAEWRGAIGAADGDKYFWGDANPSAATLNCNENRKGAMPVNLYESGKTRTGLYNMGGNVWEWLDSVETEKSMALSKGYRIITGGSWRTFIGDISIDLTGQMRPGANADDTGFRCLLPEEK